MCLPSRHYGFFQYSDEEIVCYDFGLQSCGQLKGQLHSSDSYEDLFWIESYFLDYALV